VYAPVLLPQAEPPSAAVLAAERAILATEGPYHVEGRYLASASDADRQRRLVAERVVRDEARRQAWAEHTDGNANRDHQRAAPAARPPIPRVAVPRVTTWLTVRERERLDTAAVACGGCLMPAHRDTLAAVRDDLAAGETDAALVSVARLTPADVPALASLVRGFPGVPVAGFVGTIDDARAVGGALLLGHAGVRTVIDARTAAGWHALRAAFVPRRLPDAFLRACVASVLADLRGSGDGSDLPDGLVRFFALTFAPDVDSAREIATRLGVLPSTLACRFYRAGLPSPRRYQIFARLTWAAWLGEQPGRSLADIAARLDVSGPQTLHRLVRTFVGCSAAEFRRTMTGCSMLDRYRATLVTPHRDRLRTFDPTAAEQTARRAFVVRSAATGRAA
jgi:AraC-like DNA-binding protein